METKNSNYLSEQIENSGKKGKRSFAVEVLRDQIITQGVFVNKTNQPNVFVTSGETTFDMSANFEGLTTKDVIQRELDRFFIWEFLTNENILRVLEKHECIIYCIIWHLAKESGSWEVFITEKNRLEVTTQVTFLLHVTNRLDEIFFCAEEVPVEVANIGTNSHKRFMDPISRVNPCNLYSQAVQ